ncbi:MAG TPA: hypothetical protein VF212_12155 [Longimicrobiales bacterium]
MSKRTRWIVPLALLFTAIGGLPRRALASCTTSYMWCLNDSYDTRGMLRFLADVECLAEYIGCVRRKL